MPVPSPRNKILPARGNFADLQGNLSELLEGEICYAFDQDQYYQKEGGVLVAVGATKAQGLLAESALQPGDNISELYNDLGYVQAGDIIDAPVQSVNGKIGDVELDAEDVGAPSDSEFAALEGRVLNSETDISGIEATLPNKADLVNGVIPTSQIPSIAITEFLGDVSSEAEMLALTGQPGDWCFRNDEGFGYVVIDTPTSVISSWQQIATPGGDVNSVNGQTGTVVLSAADVGAIPATELPNLAPATIDLQTVTDNGSTTTNSATFGGAVSTQGVWAGDIANGPYAYCAPTGSIDVWPSGNTVFTGKDLSGSATTTINADGSASFAGNATLFTSEADTALVAGAELAALKFSSASNTDYCSISGHRNSGASGSGRISFNLTGGEKARFDESGNLLIGGTLAANPAASTPNITLSANGSASFSNTVASPSFFGNGTGAAQIWYGGTGTSIITADGTATFADNVESGNVVKGQALLGNQVSAVGQIFIGQHNGVTKSYIQADGSATFAGSVTVGDADDSSATGKGINLNVGNTSANLLLQAPSTASDTSNIFRAMYGTSESVAIKNNGNATFAGDVSIGTPATEGIVLYEAGQILAKSAGDSIAIQVNRNTSNNFRVDSTGHTYIGTGINAAASNANIALNANDGSASFNGLLSANDRIDAYHATTNSNSFVQRWFSDIGGTQTQKAVILADGSASFGGTSIGHAASTGTQIYKDLGQVIVSTTDTNGLSIYKTGVADPGVKLQPDGSASFTGTVDAAGFTVGGVPIGGGGGDTEDQIAALIQNPTLSAWGSFKGVTSNGNTTVFAGFNCATVARSSVGVYEVAFQTPLANNNYSVTTGAASPNVTVNQLTTNGFRITYRNNAGDLTDPGSSGSTASAFFQVASTARNGTLGGGADAWGNINGSTATLRGGFNCSVARNGGQTGRYIVTFDNPMPNANYSVVTGNQASRGLVGVQSLTPTQFEITSVDEATGAFADLELLQFAVFATDGNAGGFWVKTGDELEPLQALKVKATTLNLTGLPVHADEAAATSGGLEAGDVYRTSTGELRIKL